MNNEGAPADGANAVEERIFGLLTLAEDQQIAVRAGIEGLALERAAFAKERVALAQQLEALRSYSPQMINVIVEAGVQVSKISAKAANDAVKAALAEAGETAMREAVAATKSTLDGFSSAVGSAVTERRELKRAVEEFRRKYLFFACCITAAAIMAIVLVAYLMASKERQEVAALAERREALTAEVNVLQGQVDQLKRGGGRRPVKP